METQINSVMTVIHAETDLNKGVFKTPLNCLLAEEDNQGHRIDVEVTRDGTPITLTGASVSGYFVRSRDNSTVLVNGSISGSTAHIALSKACYAQVGQFSLVIKIVMGGSTSTVFYGYGSVTRSRTDSVVDDENIIQSLDEILALIDTMETVTQETQAAGISATTAASNANEKAQAAQSASEAANAGAQAAQTAAGVANAAAGKIDNMTVSATALDTGQPPTAALSEVDGHYLLSLGLPRGATGATPQISFVIATGEPGTDAAVTGITGTAENPVLHLTIPRGDTGSIEGLTINGKVPDASSNVTLTAESVGARPATWTPSASDVGAYPAGSIRTLNISLAASAWTGSGPYTVTINQAGVTANTDCRFELGGTQTRLAADIAWKTAAGTIMLTTAAKPTGTISGTVILTEVSV